MNVKQLLDEEDEDGQLEETNHAMMRLISHFIFQWFDTKYNKPLPILRQCFTKFFWHFVLFSEHQYKLQLQAVLQVVFSFMASNFWKPKQLKKIKKEHLSSLGPDQTEEEVEEDEEGEEEEGAV
mmetsp:Transcript_13865/g.21622  ORF Transcript_13865/g.21622 Transcript_13865/m.21622 type:complete len:124 (-) Transcript_13865:50-421(-)